jgi:peroxiredoxin
MRYLARRRALVAMLAAPVLGAGGCTRQEAMPQFRYTRLDGSVGSSQALRGQVLLVNFWASNCAPCVREMPAFVALHRSCAGRGLQTLAVSMRDDPPARVADFAAARRLPFDVVIDNTGAIAAAFGDVRLTPTTFVIDRRGTIVRRVVGEADFAALQTLVTRLLGEAPPAG